MLETAFSQGAVESEVADRYATVIDTAHNDVDNEETNRGDESDDNDSDVDDDEDDKVYSDKSITGVNFILRYTFKVFIF